MPDLLFLTELIGLRAFDLRGRRIGRIRDAALVPLSDANRVDRFLIGGGWAWLTVRYDQVRTIGLDGLFLRDEQLTPYHNDDYMLRLVRDLLDQQIIDAKGRKVVRVTDVTFEVRRLDDHDELVMADIDVGMRSILRRLAQGIVPPRWVRRLQRPVPPQSIAWRYCNIVEPDPQRRLRLNISYQGLANLHPADLADIVEDLGADERGALIATLDDEVAAGALSEVEPEMQASILETLEPEKAADIIEEMAPDEAADALHELEEEAAGHILEEMEPSAKSEVAELLEFRDDTAGGLMNTEFLSFAPDTPVREVMGALVTHAELLPTLTTLFLVDGEGRLAGTVPVTRLFLAPGEAAIGPVAIAEPPLVEVAEKQDRVVEIFDKYNLLALPVVDEERRLVGVITADDIISLLCDR